MAKEHQVTGAMAMATVVAVISGLGPLGRHLPDGPAIVGMRLIKHEVFDARLMELV
jgi:hypothetical protein